MFFIDGVKVDGDGGGAGSSYLLFVYICEVQLFLELVTAETAPASPCSTDGASAKWDDDEKINIETVGMRNLRQYVVVLSPGSGDFVLGVIDLAEGCVGELVGGGRDSVAVARVGRYLVAQVLDRDVVIHVGGVGGAPRGDVGKPKLVDFLGRTAPRRRNYREKIQDAGCCMTDLFDFYSFCLKLKKNQCDVVQFHTDTFIFFLCFCLSKKPSGGASRPSSPAARRQKMYA